eukprot:12116668-Karenia_brevis.AAC.1
MVYHLHNVCIYIIIIRLVRAVSSQDASSHAYVIHVIHYDDDDDDDDDAGGDDDDEIMSQ